MMYGLDHATVRFGDITALQDVSIGVAPGQVVALVGGDGAGKTTALRALVGRVALDAGSINAPDLRQIGYLPATQGSWQELTVAENLEFVGSMYGLRGAALRQRSEDLIDRAGLRQARDRLAGRLSGGMRRKLGYSLAIMHSPQLLVLDEPSTGVDPVSRTDLWRLISQAAVQGAAVLLSTTYLDEAERAGAIVLLDRGAVLLKGQPQALVAGFDAVITSGPQPVRPDWSWRRGGQFHELWPSGTEMSAIAPDLEDVVVAASLRARQAA